MSDTPQPDWQIVHATEDADFDQIFQIREAVFEQEMGIPEEAQVDGFDAVAHHYILLHGNRAVAVARWRVTLGGNIRLERLAVLPEHRRRGFGTALMEQMLAHIPRNRDIVVECPASQQAYFEKFGFEVVEDGFDFQGIPHVRMHLRQAAA